jgi:hypothetical protein
MRLFFLQLGEQDIRLLAGALRAQIEPAAALLNEIDRQVKEQGAADLQREIQEKSKGNGVAANE